MSLLSVFNRIFERLIYKRLKSFIDKYDILSKSQHGFQENCSTQHAPIDIVNKIQLTFDKKKLYLCGIFIDLKKKPLIQLTMIFHCTNWNTTA